VALPTRAHHAIFRLAMAIALGLVVLVGAVSAPSLPTSVVGSSSGGRIEPETVAAADAFGSSPGPASPTTRPSHTPSLSPDAKSRPAPIATSSPPQPTPDAAPALDAAPTPDAAPALDPPARPGPFAIDLFEKGDFVSQATKIYCVPASMQTMMNIIEEGADRDPEVQNELYVLSRDLSTDRLRGDGAEPEGWARALDELGYGPYDVDEAPSLRAAIIRAARALRLTGKPVGLLMWRGAHAWVMSGFKATADPAYTNDFEVTHVHIEDPWYPRVSSIWGASRPPDALVPVSRLDEDYLRWRRPTVRYPEKDGLFVLVVPVAAPTS
jgi:hypothetical protein